MVAKLPDAASMPRFLLSLFEAQFLSHVQSFGPEEFYEARPLLTRCVLRTSSELCDSWEAPHRGPTRLGMTATSDHCLSPWGDMRSESPLAALSAVILWILYK